MSRKGILATREYTASKILKFGKTVFVLLRNERVPYNLAHEAVKHGASGVV